MNPDKIQIILPLGAKHSLHLITLIFPKQPMIHKHTGKLLPDRLRKQDRRHRRIHPARQRTENSSISNLIPNLPHRLIHKRIHPPVPRTSAHIQHEIRKHLRPFLRMQHLRMELNRIQSRTSVFRRRHRTVRRMGSNLKSRRHLKNRIEMAHPAHRLIRNAPENLRIPLVHQDLRLAILSHIRTRYVSAKHMHHKLRPITKPQNRNPQLKKLLRIRGRIRLIAAIWPSCQDNPLRVHRLNLLKLRFIRINLAIHIALPDASRHKLVILSPKIQHNH